MVIIRTVKPSDAIAVAELRLAWANERSDAVEPVESYVGGLAAWISAHRDNVIGKIAQQPGGPAVGMGWLAVLDRLPVPTRHNRRSGDIQSVFVVPEYRKTGLGRTLINELVDEGRARGLDRIVLHSSTAGAGFYRRIGWSNSDLLLELNL